MTGDERAIGRPLYPRRPGTPPGARLGKGQESIDPMRRREQEHIARAVAHWRGLADIDANRFATGRVRHALRGDWVAQGIVRSLVYNLVSTMRLPASSLSRDMAEYRARVSLHTIERLECNDMRSWRAYMARVERDGQNGFKSFVLVAATRAAIALSRRENKPIGHQRAAVETELEGPAPNPAAMESLIKLMELLPRFNPRDVRGLLARAAGHDWSTIARIAGFPSEDSARKAVKRLRVRLRDLIKS